MLISFFQAVNPGYAPIFILKEFYTLYTTLLFAGSVKAFILFI